MRFLILILLLVPLPVWAKNIVRSEMASPRCDQRQLQQLADRAFVKIEKGEKDYLFYLTLDVDKLTFVALVKKMQVAGCF